MFATVENLQTGIGETSLGILRVYKEIWDVTVYQVRIETHWEGVFPKLPPQEFELTCEECEKLVAYADRRPWIAALKDLVKHGSAKAYYRVRKRLLVAGRSQMMQDEEEPWSAKWGTKVEVSITNLFQRRLTTIPDNIMACAMPQIMLPCGHASHLNCWETGNIKGIGLEKEACEVCQARVLQLEDDDYLESMQQKREAYRFQVMQRVWANLIGSVMEPNIRRTFHSTSICKILGAALDTLRSPEHVAPGAICPSRFVETGLVLENLQDMFWERDQTCERTAKELLEELEHESLGVHVDGVALAEWCIRLAGTIFLLGGCEGLRISSPTADAMSVEGESARVCTRMTGTGCDMRP